MRTIGLGDLGYRTTTRGPLRLVWFMGLVALVAGCGRDAPEGPSSFTHDEEAIQAADGSVVFHRDSLPPEVAVAEARFPDDRTRAISVPEAESLSPEERIYTDAAWEAGALCFTLKGERYCVDPAAS